MVETALSLVCLIVLLLTRSRLERAERRLRELDVTLTKLQGDLADQAKRLAQSEAQLAGRLPEPFASTGPRADQLDAVGGLPLAAAPVAASLPAEAGGRGAHTPAASGPPQSHSAASSVPLSAAP